MKNLVYFVFLFCTTHIIPAQADITAQNTLKCRIEQWAEKHPDLYSAGYFSSLSFLSIGAGALYARLFKPGLLTKAFEDSTAGAEKFLSDPHVIGALATFLSTGLGGYFAPIFLNDIRNQLPDISLVKGQFFTIALLSSPILLSRLFHSAP